jgi:hypothetical protein
MWLCTKIFKRLCFQSKRKDTTQASFHTYSLPLSLSLSPCISVSHSDSRMTLKADDE